MFLPIAIDMVLDQRHVDAHPLEREIHRWEALGEQLKNLDQNGLADYNSNCSSESSDPSSRGYVTVCNAEYAG